MASVTSVIKQTKQPRGGYIKLKSADIISFDDGYDLKNKTYKDINPSLIGTVVDYITRYVMSYNFKQSFHISLIGYNTFKDFISIKKIKLKEDSYHMTMIDNLNESIYNNFLRYKSEDILNLKGQIISNVDDHENFQIYGSFNSETNRYTFDSYKLTHVLITSLHLCLFDVFVRNLPWGLQNWTRIQDIYDELCNLSHNMEDDICLTICIMIKRSLDFFDIYGPIVEDGFSFPGAFTSKINSGDGDFLTKDTLWDFKCSKNEPTSVHTLQLLVYYLMGLYSDGAMHTKRFKNIKNLGIFNPKLNKVYIWKLYDILQDIETIKTVGKDVIGYDITKPI